MMLSYSLIRVIPDLGRGEVRNVGVVVWSATEAHYELDDSAVRRARDEAPRLIDGTWSALGDYVEEVVRPNGMFDEGAFLRTVGRDAIGQILFSEPLQVEQMDTLEETAAFVSTRLVMPAVRTHRYSGAKPSDALRVLRRHFRGLIQSDRLRCDFSVPQTMSSVPRSVRFFSAVEEGVTLEMAHLAIADRSEAIHRADAAAFKAQDLLGANPGLRLGLLCSATTGGIEDVSCSAALQIIEGAGVEVVADFGAAVRFMVEAAGSDEPDWARWSARSSPIPDELNLSSVALLN